MKFMLLMMCPENAYEKLGSWAPADFKAHIEFMIAFDKKLKARGELVAAEGLDDPRQTKIVRSQKSGVPAITDGPFAESKEFLAGFWIVDCESEARAIAIANEASAAPGPGGAPMSIPIELRRVGSAPKV